VVLFIDYYYKLLKNKKQKESRPFAFGQRKQVYLGTYAHVCIDKLQLPTLNPRCSFNSKPVVVKRARRSETHDWSDQDNFELFRDEVKPRRDYIHISISFDVFCL
jgi:hypothetical protein